MFGNKEAMICMGDAIIQKIASTGKDQCYDFDGNVEVKCRSNGISFFVEPHCPLSESYKKAVSGSDKINKNDIQICAYSKSAREGFFAITLTYPYRPGKSFTCYCGAEFKYKIKNLEIDLLKEVFPNQPSISNEKMYSFIRENIVVPVMTDVIKTYLDRLGNELDQPLDTLNFMLLKKQDELFEKAEALCGEKAMRVFNGKLELEVFDIRVDQKENCLRLQ